MTVPEVVTVDIHVRQCCAGLAIACYVYLALAVFLGMWRSEIRQELRPFRACLLCTIVALCWLPALAVYAVQAACKWILAEKAE